MTGFLTGLLIFGAAGTTLAACVVSQRRLVAQLASRFRSLPRAQQALLVFAVGIATISAQKDGVRKVEARGGGGERTDNLFLVSQTEQECLSNNSQPQASTSTSLQSHVFESCLPLVRVGTNEVFDFSAPEGATVAENWRRRGASKDYLRLDFSDWAFPFGDTLFSNLVVFAGGRIRLSRDAEICPFAANLGLVPEANWASVEVEARGGGGERTDEVEVEARGGERTDEVEVEARGGEGTVNLLSVLLPTEKESLSNHSPPQASTSTFLSQFWHYLTPSNTLVLTWQNALLERETANPVSFQAELFPSGNVVFRYDLARLGDEGLLTNAVVSVKGREGLEGREGRETEEITFTRSLTSLFFKTENELRCDAARERFDDALGGLDPLALPTGSTNTVWEHYVYTGTTNGAFSPPESTASAAVLRVAVSGAGRGELVVAGHAVPLVGEREDSDWVAVAALSLQGLEGREGRQRLETEEKSLSYLSPPQASTSTSSPPQASTSTSLFLPVPRGRTTPLYLRADGTLAVSFDSDDFAFGSLPDLAASRLVGRINFPNVTATVPCFHDYKARRKAVSLPVGDGADKLDLRRFYWTVCLLLCFFTTEETERIGRNGKKAPDQAASRNPRPIIRFLAHSRSWASSRCSVALGEKPKSATLRAKEYERNRIPYRGKCKTRREPYRAAASEMPPYPCTMAGAHLRCARRWFCNYFPASGRAVRFRSHSFNRGTADLGFFAVGNEQHLNVNEREWRKRRQIGRIRFRRSGWTVPFASADFRAFRSKKRLHGNRSRKRFPLATPCLRDSDFSALGDSNSTVATSFGLPVPVTTNAADAASLALVTDVGLPSGNVHVGFEGASAPFALWVRDTDSEIYRRLASSDGGALDVSLAAWRELVGGATDAATSRTAVRVTAAGAGAADLVFRYWNVVGGKFVEDEARQRLTAVDSPLRADVDRDGKIDAADAALIRAGRSFRFWTNQSAESRVGGESGRLNLFPLAVDVTPFRCAWGDAVSIRLRVRGKTLRFCRLDGVTAENASAVWTDDVQTADGVPLVDAEMSPIPSEGLDVGEMSAGEVLALSAVADVGFGTSPELVVSIGGVEVYGFRLPTELHPVREMYRHFSVRASCDDTRAVDVRTGVPSGLPDDETDGRHFVFVHGYNVGPDAAREWADAMFKRLLLVGSRSMFTSVTWFGDYAQVWDGVPVVGGRSLNYYRNVQYAFLSAAPFKSVVDGLQGRKVLLAHSLGNVLVSSAIVDHGLVDYEKYHLLNAAVPMEAYDGRSQTDAMVDGAWADVPQFRASRWHEWFAAPDFRAGLSWKGRFGVIPRAENCYSATEDVLENPSVGGMGDAWGKQELLKGTAALYGTGILLQNIAVEGGWGVNARLVANPLAYVPGIGFRASYFKDYTREEAIAQPLFTSFDDTRMASTNALEFADAALRAKMLGDAIPAESFATGSNATDGFVNYEYLSNASHGWPTRNKEWHHSDIKNIDYRYVQDFFRHIKEATEQ